MAENRFKRRHRKRISVNFGVNEVAKFGFTDDVNHGGLFIRSSVCVKPGVKIRVEMKQPEGLIALIGEVKWAKKVPPNVIHKMKGGMGVEIISFIAGEDIYHSLCDELVSQRGE